MAKRHTDTGIFDQQWFQQLAPAYKCFWFYLCAKCDHAGIWDVNLPLAKFYIGSEEIGEVDEVLKLFEDRIVDLGNDKWYLKKYVSFHHGETLHQNNNFHNSIIKSLDRYGLVEKNKESEENEYIVKSEPGEKKKVIKQPNSRRKLNKPSLEQVREYCKERKNEVDAQQFLNHYESNGWKIGKVTMADWKASVRTWEKNDQKNKINSRVYIDPNNKEVDHGF
tara:strand:- start:705 stop:1370 length:666 start_codon:yes stop_codon:yes gene_type:complete